MKSSKIIADMALSAPIKLTTPSYDPKAFLADLKDKVDWVKGRNPLTNPCTIYGWQIALLLATSGMFRGVVSARHRQMFDDILAEEIARIQELFAPKVENQNLKKSITRITQL